MATETERFLDEMLPLQRDAELAIHNGDPEPRMVLWSRNDPVTVFGAKISNSGWPDLEQMFRQVASWFSDCTEYEFEVIAAGASGDLAYTVGYERSRLKMNGQPRRNLLRVTHVYRREDGQWRIVHRHADVPPDESTPL